MTPQVEAFAPLVGAVFGDSEATGVTLPWRLTDRSQQSEAGLGQGLLGLLQLGGERLTATALETLLGCGPLLRHQGIDPAEAGALTALLQRAGFRWGLDGRDRGGDSSHSLGWAIDRLVLGLVLPQEPGLAPGETAPLAMSGSLEQQGRWLGLLRQLQRSLHWLGQARSVADWVTGLRQQLPELFGDGGELAWELQAIQAVLADWNAVAGASPLLLEAPVVAEVLGERLSESSGRFGHRSGALTISALEPMRAIPHRVVVLMGLDAGAFPRQRQRPGFHLLEQQRRLGDPSSGDQDRYVRNFLPQTPWPPVSCDRRLLTARHQLERNPAAAVQGLAWREPASPGDSPVPLPPELAWTDLLAWIEAPQASWLEALGLRPREWDTPVRDLEDLRLDERQRSALLRSQLDGDGLPAPDALQDAPPDWSLLERGRGSLPPLAAGQLEVRQLEQRWTSLQHCLELLGPPQRRTISWQGLQATLSWRGNQLVLSHTSRPRCRRSRKPRWSTASAAGRRQRPGPKWRRPGGPGRRHPACARAVRCPRSRPGRRAAGPAARVARAAPQQLLAPAA